MPPSSPEVIGKYSVQRWIESGGMGDIYLARDPTLDRPVAIKLLREGFDSEELRERFEREARAAGRLSHPNIVTVYEFGDFEGRPFIAMEFVAGESLAKLIRRKAPLSLPMKLEMMEGLCAGLAHAHRGGIVHRDIKPANLMVDAEGAIKVLDFGIVRMAGSGLTHHGVLVGTVNYMSPEQIAGSGTIDHRSDVFAVGTVFYELLASKRAFPGEMAEVLYKIVHADPEPLAKVCPGIDPAIERAVHRCLEKSPDRRYQELTQLRRDLSRIRQRIEVEEGEPASTVVRPHDAPVPTPPPIPPDTVAPVLTEAESALARHDVDRAISLAEHAAALAPHDPRPRELLQKAERVRQARTLSGALNRAQTALARKEYEAARQATDEALAVDPQNAMAKGLKREIDSAITAMRRLEAHDRSALEAIGHAKRLFNEGKHAAAFDRLERFAPPHVQVIQALAELRALHEQQARARKELEARTERLHQLIAAARQALALDDLTAAGAAVNEATALATSLRVGETEVASAGRALDERTRDLKRVAQCLEDGDVFLARGELEQARQAAQEAHRLRPGDAAAVTLGNRVQQAFEARRAEEAHRRAEQERQRTIDAWLHEARNAPDENRARAALNKIFEIEPFHADARRVLEEMRRKQEERRRQIQEQIAQGRKAVDEGRFADAVRLLRPLAPGPEASHDPAFLELLARADAGFEQAEAARRRQEKLSADLKTAADKAGRAEFAAARAIIQAILTEEPGHTRARALRDEIVKTEEVHARAENTSEKALALFDRGDHSGAIALLERFSPPHPLASATLADLRARFDEIERARRRAEQAERRRQAVQSATATLGALVRDRRLLGLLLATVVAVATWRLWPTLEYELVPPPPGPRHTADLVLKGESEEYDMERELARQQQAREEGRQAGGVTAVPGTEPGGTPGPTVPVVVRKLPSGSQTGEPSAGGGVTSPAGGSTTGSTKAGGTQAGATPPGSTQPGAAQPGGTPSGGVGVPSGGAEPASVPSSGAGTAGGASSPGPVSGAGGGTKPAEEKATPEPAGGGTSSVNLKDLARQEVQAWLKEYERVYATLDESAIRRLNPTAAQGISRTRELASSAMLTFSNVRIEPTEDGQGAFVEAEANYRYKWKRAGLPEARANAITWTLRRTGNSWVVKNE